MPRNTFVTALSVLFSLLWSLIISVFSMLRLQSVLLHEQLHCEYCVHSHGVKGVGMRSWELVSSCKKWTESFWSVPEWLEQALKRCEPCNHCGFHSPQLCPKSIEKCIFNHFQFMSHLHCSYILVSVQPNPKHCNSKQTNLALCKLSLIERDLIIVPLWVLCTIPDSNTVK